MEIRYPGSVVEVNEFLGKPIKFWIDIKCVLEIFLIDSPQELEGLLSVVVERERVIYDRGAEQLGGKVGMVPAQNIHKEE